jgi:uncharacterized membrane protein
MTWDTQRIFTAIAACILFLFVGTTGFIAVGEPTQGESFTEFYILGENGTASGYPTDLVLGERGTVFVGVVNHEQEVETYTIVLRLNGTTADRRTVTVPDEERWETEMSFVPQSSGQTSVQFVLYDERNPSPGSKPYRTLRLWVTILGG